MKQNTSFRFLAFLIIACLFITLAVLLPFDKTLAAVDDNYTVVLLHMNGVDTSTTFIDENGRTWTAYGDAQIRTNQAKFGGASGSLVASSNSYLSTVDNADFYFGTDPFTIDTWVYLNSLPVSGNSFIVYNQRADDNNRVTWSIYNSSGTYSLWLRVLSNGTATISCQRTITISTLTWYHIAISRDGSNAYQFLNGIQQGTVCDVSTTTIQDIAGPLWIGTFNLSVNYFNGYIDEFRVSKGIARWTSDFTPPTGEYEATSTNTPTDTANATATFLAGQTATANAITATAAYNLTATSNAATTTAQWNNDLTATSSAATATAAAQNALTQTAAAIYDAQTATQAFINGQTATAQYNIDLTSTALSWTPTFTITPSATATLGTPLAMGTMYWDSRMTYADVAQMTELACIGLFLFLISVIFIFLTILQKSAGPK